MVEQAASMVRLISPKRTKKLQVEHESKFSEVVADSVKTSAMRAVFHKDILERFLDGPF